MRKLLAALTLAAAALVTLPGTAVTVDLNNFPPCSGSPSFTCRDLFIDSFDSTLLDATLYVPNAATALTPAPAVLMTHGYGGWHRGSGDMTFQQELAKNGFVVLAYTSRGFGRSSGQVQLDSPDYEVRDAKALISWLANSSNTGGVVTLDGVGDPRVGMAGGSYAGGIQLLTAAYDTRLDAITPQITWNDLRYALSPNGVIKHGWIDLLFASGKAGGYAGPLGGSPPVIGTDGVPQDQEIQVLSTYLANDNVDAPVAFADGSGCTNSYCYLKKRSVTWDNVITKITAPTFLIQGQRDTLFWLNEMVRNEAGISANGAPTKMLVYSAGHGYSDITGERAAINARIVTWFDKYLNGNALANTGPALEVWRPWATFAGYDALPGGFPSPNYGVSGGAPVTILNAVAPTSHSETTNFQSSTNGPSGDYAPGATSMEVSTGALGAPLTIAGVPKLTFTISATAPEAIVFAKLWDVDPVSGARTLIHHQVTPARVRAGYGDFCSGYIPGVPQTSIVSGVNVCMSLAGLVYRVPAGHALALTLATSETTYFGSRYPGVYTISSLKLDLPTTSLLP